MNNTIKSARSATHYGTCQICGRLQKASHDRSRGGDNQWVAKHGYELHWYSQVGECHGSGHEPLEVSCEYAKVVVAKLEKAIADYVAQPRPTNVGTTWKPSPELVAWQRAVQQHESNKQFVKHLRSVVSNWTPRQQKEVREVEAAQAAERTARTGIRALSSALADAKRRLSKHGEKFTDAIEAEVNAPLLVERNAWYAAHPNECFPKHVELLYLGCFTTAKVNKLLGLVNTLANPSSSLVEGAELLRQLDAAYRDAKAAYEACKGA